MSRLLLSTMRCILPVWLRLAFFLLCLLAASTPGRSADAPLMAGAAKVDITNLEAGPVNDRLYARALVLKQGETTAVIVAVDAVAIGEIGYIKNDYLPNVRAKLQETLGIAPTNVVINASHCHGVVCKDVGPRTVQAVVAAAKRLEPVHIGVGRGHEDRVQENRRLVMKDGRVIDVRHAYSLPPDDEVAAVGPIDPEIGVLRLDRQDGSTLAVVYNFACHPIQGVLNRGNTADMTGFSSKVIEENLGKDTVALFVQGCAGDINPAFYKDVAHPRDAEPLGNMLGLSTLRAVRSIRPKADPRLTVVNEILELPRADVAGRITELEAERTRLVDSLTGTSLNLKTFIPLVLKYNVSPDSPLYYSHRYLHEQALGREGLAKMDAENRSGMKRYVRNIHTMEQITRINTNLRLLRKHQADNLAATQRMLQVELVGLRVGDFVLTTFPGELTVKIGMNIKKQSPHEFTFVAGYTNGYIYYAPTTEQLKNVGNAQEDSDCILAPQWQAIYEKKAAAILRKL